MKPIKLNKKNIGIILIVLFVIFMIFVFKKSKNEVTTIVPPPLTILDSIPKNESTKISVFDPLTITLNQKVDPSEISISSIPEEDWVYDKNISNSLIFKHKLYLKVATKYDISIFYNKTPVGNIKFETEHIQNDPRLLQTLNEEFNRDYPLASLLPFETEDFIVVYSEPLTFEIKLKGNLSGEDAILQTQSWVQQNGTDFKTHKYKVRR